MKIHLLPPNDGDPVLSINYMIAALNISRDTFNRVHRPKIPMMAISERRRGARKSVFEAYLRSLELPPGK